LASEIVCGGIFGGLFFQQVFFWVCLGILEFFGDDFFSVMSLGTEHFGEYPPVDNSYKFIMY